MPPIPSPTLPNSYGLKTRFADICGYRRHAGRSTISTDDVMLLGRRNEGLEAVLKSYLEKQKGVKGNRGKR